VARNPGTGKFSTKIKSPIKKSILEKMEKSRKYSVFGVEIESLEPGPNWPAGSPNTNKSLFPSLANVFMNNANGLELLKSSSCIRETNESGAETHSRDELVPIVVIFSHDFSIKASRNRENYRDRAVRIRPARFPLTQFFSG
jgi:hypothetical protein